MKKQIAAILTAAVFDLGVTACGAAADEGQEPRGTSQEEAQESSQETSQDEASQTQDAQTDTEDQDGGSSNILIAYFSVPEDVDTEGIDADAGDSIVVKDGQVMGNLEYMADVIQQSTGGDIFRIETVDQYPLDHDTLVDQAAQEQDDEARPQLAGQIEATDQYDTILLGYPIWWGESAWPVDSFVENNDFTGKTVIPFATSASSGLGDSGQLLADMAGTGDWQEGMRFRSGVDAADVQEWVSGLGL